MKNRKSIKKMICVAITVVFALGVQVYAEEPDNSVGEEKAKSEYNDVLYAYLTESEYDFEYLDGYYLTDSSELRMLPYYGDVEMYYALTDMDGNGTDELFIGAASLDPAIGIYGVWIYDGKKPYKFMDDYSLGYRTRCIPCQYGIYKVTGSGGAYTGGIDFYKLGTDGYSKELVESLYYDGFPSGNMKYYHSTENVDFSQYTEISKSEFDRIENRYTEKELDWRLLDDTAIVKEGNEPFVDVISADWFYDPVEAVYNSRLMTGMTPVTFGPAENLSRAQFSTILYRMEGEPFANYAGQFPDVPFGQFYTASVAWANKANVIGGYSNGCFGPADSITREQMAVMMYRYAQYKNYNVSDSADLSNFPDVQKVSSFSGKAMEWAVGAGLIKGDMGNINPQGNASRAQCATIIQRFMDKYPSNAAYCP